MRHQLPKVIHLQSSSGCDEWSMQPGIAQNYLRESNYLVRRGKRSDRSFGIELIQKSNVVDQDAYTLLQIP